MATKAEQTRWHELATDADVHEVARTVAEHVTVAQACTRIATLGRFPREPLVGEALLNLLREPPWRSAGANPFWSLWCFALLHHVPPLERLRGWEAQVARDGHLEGVDVDRATAWFLGMRLRRLLTILERDATRARAAPPAAVDATVLERALAIDGEEAFELAHRAWTRWRTPALTHAVCALGERFERAGIGMRERTETWHAIAERHDPIDLPRLLACIGATPTSSFLETLLEWPYPDPRIATLAAEQLVSPPWALVRPIALAIAGLAVLHPSPTALTTMAPHRPHAPHLALLHAAVESRLACFEENGAIDAVSAPFAPKASLHDGRADELLAAIYDAPDDRPLRRVYGDLLLERGDPRGELIELQGRARLKRADKKRLRELVCAHFDDWVGLLGPVLLPPDHRTRPPTWFEDGFLYSAALSSLGKLEDVRADAPAWSTVRELHLPRRLRAKAFRLLGSPHLDGLRRLTGLPLDRAKSLRGKLPSLDHLVVTGTSDLQDIERVQAGWSHLRDRTGLRHLWLVGWMPGFSLWGGPQPHGLEPLLGSALADRLAWLGLELARPGSALFPLRRHVQAWLSYLDVHLPHLGVELFHDVSSRDAVARLERVDGRFAHLTFVVPERSRRRDPFSLLALALEVLDPLTTLTVVAPRKPSAMSHVEDLAERADVARVEHRTKS